MNHRNGYYDKTGRWQRLRFCFSDCGELCNCKPLNGKWQLDKDELKQLEESKKHA